MRDDGGNERLSVILLIDQPNLLEPNNESMDTL